MIKIVAVVHTIYTNTYDTLYYEAKKNPNVEFTFVVIPLCKPEASITFADIKANMLAKNYPFILGYDEENEKYLDLVELNPDVVIFQTPYAVQRGSRLYSAQYVSNFAYAAVISYGATMIQYTQLGYKDMIKKNKDFHFYDKSLVPSQMHADMMNEFHADTFMPIGYMKCDKLLNYKDNPDFRFKERDKGYKTIITWKPRWTTTIGTSNFLTYLEYFIQLALNNDDILIKFFRHNLMQKRMVKRKIFTENAASELFAKMESIKNIQILKDEEFLDDVYNSDIFVGDFSSTILEFFLFSKPTIYTPTEVSLNPLGEKVIKGMYVVNNVSGMDKTIKGLRAGQDPLKEIRAEVSQLVSMPTHNHKSIALYLLDYFLNFDYEQIKCEIVNTNALKQGSYLTQLKNKIAYTAWLKLDQYLFNKKLIYAHGNRYLRPMKKRPYTFIANMESLRKGSFLTRLRNRVTYTSWKKLDQYLFCNGIIYKLSEN